MLNSYGNDLSEASRMNNAADAMKRERLGSPVGTPEPGGVSLFSLMGGADSLSPTASPPVVTNSFGNDMTEANRMNAGADAMRQSRLGTPAPGSLAGSLMGVLVFDKPAEPGTEPTDTRTWGDIEQKPYFSGVSNAGAMGGNF